MESRSQRSPVPCHHPVLSPQIDISIKRPSYSQYSSRGPSSAIPKAAISQTLSELDQDLESCLSEMNYLKARMNHLETRRVEIRDFRAELRELISPSPISWLPDELLLGLFEDVCAENIIESEKARLPPALSISGVCQKWRNIVNACPRSWSSLRFLLTDPTSDVGMASIADLYCRRSAQLPLDIYINAPVWENHSVLERLLKDATRWKTFEFSGYVLNGFPSTFELLDLQYFPILESVTVNVDYDWDNDEDGLDLSPCEVDVCFLNDLHRVHTLETSTIKFISLNPHTCWETVDSLTYHANIGGNAFDIIRSCVNLDDLTIHGSNTWNVKSCKEELEKLADPLLLPSLDTLRVIIDKPSTSTRDMLGVILGSLRLPSLTSLYLVHREGDLDGSLPLAAPHVHSLLARSGCPLDTLFTRGITFTDAESKRILELAPTLAEGKFEQK